MVEYKSSGLVTPLVFDDCECDIPTGAGGTGGTGASGTPGGTGGTSVTPYFYTTLSANQTVSTTGSVVARFNTIAADTMGTYNVASWGFTSSAATYDIEAMLRVSSSTDEHIPSYIEVYDSISSSIVARGVISNGVLDHESQFYTRVGVKAPPSGSFLQIRYLSLKACTICATGSWFSARKLYW